MKCQSSAVTTEFKYRWAKRNTSQPVTFTACSLVAVLKGSYLQASAFISLNTLPFLPPQAAVEAAVTTLQAQSHQWQSLLGWRQGTGRGLRWVNTFGTQCQSRANPTLLFFPSAFLMTLYLNINIYKYLNRHLNHLLFYWVLWKQISLCTLFFGKQNWQNKDLGNPYW